MMELLHRNADSVEKSLSVNTYITPLLFASRKQVVIDSTRLFHYNLTGKSIICSVMRSI